MNARARACACVRVYVCVCGVCARALKYVRTYVCPLGDGEPEGTSAPTAIYVQYSTEDPNNKNYNDTRKLRP